MTPLLCVGCCREFPQLEADCGCSVYVDGRLPVGEQRPIPVHLDNCPWLAAKSIRGRGGLRASDVGWFLYGCALFAAIVAAGLVVMAVLR